MVRRDSTYSGAGLLGTLGSVAGTVINKTIDLLPAELHLPGGYQWCGPGTNVQLRLSRGDRGINKLDSACKEHDIAYVKYKDSERRSVADRILAERAWERVKSSDSSLGEKAAAWLVTNVMKAKTKLGGGGCNNRKRRKSQKRRNKKNSVINKNRRKCQTKIKKKKKGEGLYLKPYKGAGSDKKKK